MAAAARTGIFGAMRRLHSGTAVFSAGPDGRIDEWNREAERLTGISAADAEGRHCWDVLAGRDPEGGIVCHPGCSTARLAREGWPVRCLEALVRLPLGEKRLIFSTVVVHGDNGPMILHLIHEASEQATSAPAGGAEPPLTPRQREILLLLAHGVRAKEIAERLMLSETTVRNHIQAILLALGVHSQLEAAARARMLALADNESAA
jgi:DNA-binding CsgD family transcriptional regulator